MHKPAFIFGTPGFRPVSAAGELGAARQASPELRMEFEKIVSHGLPRFRRVAMPWLRNPEDAEDAVQDATLSGFQHIAAFDGRGSAVPLGHGDLDQLGTHAVTAPSSMPHRVA
jgi:hypothetical protein